MQTGRPAPAVGFERELARALASAAASAPGIVCVALAATLLAIDNVGWAAAAGFALGALMRRMDRRVALCTGIALVLRAGWLGVTIPTSSRFPDWSFGQGVALSEISSSWWHLFVAGVAAVAFVAGIRPRRWMAATTWILGAAVVVSIVCLCATLPAEPRELLLRLSHFALGGGAIGVACLGARRRPWTAVLVMLAAALQYFVIRNVTLRIPDPVGTVAAAALLPVAYLAGTFAVDLEEATGGDAGTRLVVLAQRRPWITSLLVGAAIAGVAGPWAWEWYPVRDTVDLFTVLPLLLAAFAFLGDVGRGGRTPSDRLAPWLAANLAAIAIALGLQNRLPLHLVGALGITVSFALWPLIGAVIMPGRPPGDALPLAATTLPATLLLLPPTTAVLSGDRDGWMIPAALDLLLVPVAFHAVARSRWNSRQIVVAATALGVAWHLFAPALPPPSRREPSPDRGPVLALCVWGIGALLVIAARRARGMTAVPRDHPVVADFGGE